MPDWSYQTIFRPLLFRMKATAARDTALGAMGLLSRMPLGPLVIRTLGHMEGSSALESSRIGFRTRYPVGLSGPVDPRLLGRKAVAPFGFGFMEVGPVTLRPAGTEERCEPRLKPQEEAIVYPDRFQNDGLERIAAKLNKPRGHRLPYLLRLAPMPGSSAAEAVNQLQLLMKELGPHAAGFVIDGCMEAVDNNGGERRRGWSVDEFNKLLIQLADVHRNAGANTEGKPLLLAVPLQADEALLRAAAENAIQTGWRGFYVTEYTQDGQVWDVSPKALAPGSEAVRRLRVIIGAEPAIVAACGVHEPQDAFRLRDAGADAVMLHSGLVYSGPGLPKRINDALIFEAESNAPRTEDEAVEGTGFWSGWGWMTLLGAGMLIGGLIAWFIAVTSVMLPYDIAYLGADRNALLLANPRLLSFMSHDRVTLAGTMISIGVLYMMLGGFGLRAQLHWAKTALLVSGLLGFSSFFLYLGYGYFDPLHALAAAVLLPMFVLAMRSRAGRAVDRMPALRNDRAWRMAQWGQLIFVVLGVMLGVGGIVIASVGVTNVFVPQDLAYLCTTPDTLQSFNDKLLPLIAHDRAGFGGALVSDAAALTAAALWGIQEGQRWLWRMLVLAGLPAFTAGLSVHLYIGYIDFIHLLPLYVLIVLYIAGLLLLYPYMMKNVPQQRRSVNRG
ncbi:hypothetical protein ACFFK0_16235 [Paenibacillus chartarius]|uniref:Dihydroorotate dehydrogenase n=1 Tax=Paenibacillus chartarius TaxID=747481 RepID=A0ABV6DMV7_9BACL